jgi:predicted dehydrogenase
MGRALTAVAAKPRVGFLGVGWIGRARLEAVESLVDVAAIADPALPTALGSLDDLLEHDLDGVVIATPSALHAQQAIAALEAGCAVFCQKPLGRTSAEAAAVVAAAREADRLLAVDFCYRGTAAARALLEELPLLGRVYACELAFHNGYGPDKPWFYDPQTAGGGCAIDLGIHLVDLALWLLGRPEVERVESRLLRHGGHAVEDYAVALLDLAGGITASLSCSWNLPVGEDCSIAAVFYGEHGGAALRNVGGSFYDLRAERVRGTTRVSLAEPPDDWAGRAIEAWALRLAGDRRFDAEVASVVEVHRVIDRIYGSRA